MTPWHDLQLMEADKIWMVGRIHSLSIYFALVATSPAFSFHFDLCHLIYLFSFLFFICNLYFFFHQSNTNWLQLNTGVNSCFLSVIRSRSDDWQCIYFLKIFTISCLIVIRRLTIISVGSNAEANRRPAPTSFFNPFFTYYKTFFGMCC